MRSASLQALIAKSKPGPFGKYNNHPTVYPALFPRPLSRLFIASRELRNTNLIEIQIMSATKEYLHSIRSNKIHRLTNRSSFDTLGLTCIERVLLIMNYEEKTGIELNEEDANNRITSIYDAFLVFSEYGNNEN